jgi:pimeloyl-ACP methyl ester carboxylesterase
MSRGEASDASAGARVMVDMPSGLELEVFTAGADEPTALILAHGTPSCGMLYRGWAEVCARRGIRLVGYSRPGYGASTRHSGRSVADCADDVEAVMAALGARPHLLADEGHISIIDGRFDRIVDDLPSLAPLE